VGCLLPRKNLKAKQMGGTTRRSSLMLNSEEHLKTWIYGSWLLFVWNDSDKRTNFNFHITVLYFTRPTTHRNSDTRENQFLYYTRTACLEDLIIIHKEYATGYCWSPIYTR
jgi:hypothetical protein